MRQESDELPASVSFSEEPTGYFDFEEADFEDAFRAGAAAGRRLALQLKITADDVDRCVAEERAIARVAGWVRGDALGGPLEVDRGEFRLAVRPDGARRMDYRLHFHDGADRPLTLVGFKEVHGVQGHAAIALYTRLLAGHVDASGDSAAPVVATGILHIQPDELAKQLTTFRVSPPLRLGALARFGVLVAGDLWDTYR